MNKSISKKTTKEILIKTTGILVLLVTAIIFCFIEIKKTALIIFIFIIETSIFLAIYNYERRKNKKDAPLYDEEIGKIPSENTYPLELTPLTLNDEYRKKWNVYNNDFFQLTRNDIPINNSIYRIGIFGGNKNNNEYFMLLKNVQSFYDDLITSDKSRQPHLESRRVILNREGIEKIEFERIMNPYLIGGLIYSSENKYYNIETGEFYGESSSFTVTSDDYVFLEDKYNKDKTKRGVLKINKNDGSKELFLRTKY